MGKDIDEAASGFGNVFRDRLTYLMNGNNVAQDLSVAALTKGIGLPGTHTCMTELHLTVWDFIYPALCTLPLLWKGGILL